MLYNSKQLADYLGFSEGYVRQLVCAKKIPHIKLGRSLRFELSDIQAWINTCKVKPMNISLKEGKNE